MEDTKVLTRKELSRRIMFLERDNKRIVTLLAISIQLVKRLMDYDATHFPSVDLSSTKRKSTVWNTSDGLTSPFMHVYKHPAKDFVPASLDALFNTFTYEGYMEDET